MASQPNLVQDTIENLKILYGKSSNVTNKFSEALEVFNQAEDAGNSFIETFTRGKPSLPPQRKKTNQSLGNVIKKGELMLVTVKNAMTSDGVFWCRIWHVHENFDDNILDNISKELGWMEKEMTAKKSKPNVLNVPMFFYSEAQSKYCRVNIEKELDGSVVVRYLDLGTFGEVSKETHFYLVPQSNLREYPFQAIQGYICLNNDVGFPYEIRWMFNDLTHNQVLMARVVEVNTKDNFQCYKLALKSLINEVHITAAIFKRLKEIEKERNENEKYKVSKEKSEDNESTKKTMAASHSDPIKQNPDKEPMVTSDKNNNSVLQAISQTIHETLRLSRSRQTSYCSESDTGDVPSRCSSLDCILSAKSKKEKKKTSKSTKRSKSKDCLGSDSEVTLKKVEEKSGKQQNKEKGGHTEGSWLEGFSIDERKKVPAIIPNMQNVFYNATTLRSEPWWEIELMNINKLLESQANLKFYCYDTFVSRVEESLTDGELELFLDKNISANSLRETSKQYSQYILLRNYKKLHPDRQNNRNRRNKGSNHQQYAPLYVIGVAKLESTIHRASCRYPVTYLSLSRFKTSLPEFEQNQGRPFAEIHLSKAKLILEQIKKSLANNSRKPLFPEYYPWCGVPPLVKNMRKPDNSKNQTKPRPPLPRPQTPPQKEVQEISPPQISPPQKDNDTGLTRCMRKERAKPQSLLDGMLQEEVWDLEEGDSEKRDVVSPLSVGERVRSPELQKIDEEIVGQVEKTTSTSEPDSSPIQQHDSISSASSSTSPSSLHLEDGKGIFDTYGVWYPSTVVKEIADQEYRIKKEQEAAQSESADKDEASNEIEQAKVAEEPICDQVNAEPPVTTKRIRILQRSKPKSSNEIPPPAGKTANDSTTRISTSSTDSSAESGIGCDIKSELLNLVNSTSECCKEDDDGSLEHDERFERNCQVFNVSSEDFDC